ncbi:right-handed parallel beta-helix repeat-containing protein [Streptomyces sp. NPDC018693]|uniref:right-handed parallel beta-helix repeat-containing protein n=1 Tax=unclassified Streptomyces TaxID=2593676 RepID=UPI00379737C9
MAGRAAVALAGALLAGVTAGCVSLPHYAPSVRTYYVSADGDDSAAGTSPDRAWRTLARADRTALEPGDRLLLRGGTRFAGTLTIGADEAGDADRPVVVGSYGEGRATVSAGSSPGVSVHNTAGVEIRDLTVVGPGTAESDQAGVNLYNDAAGGERKRHVLVTDVNVSGFRVGVAVGSSVVGSGFRDVTVRRAQLHGNRDAGLLTYGPRLDAARPAYAHENVALERVDAFDNAGDPSVNNRHTGSGIIIGGVRGATVRESRAYDNGRRSGPRAPVGPAGLWAYDSTGVLIEHSAAYRNHTGNNLDGSGFGLDSNTSDSTVQYNLSFHNDGPGYYVFQHDRNGRHRNNTIRYNISSNDGRKLPHHGALTVYGIDVRDLTVHNNTVVMRTSPAGPGTVMLVHSRIHGVSIRNNILVSDGYPLVTSEAATTDRIVFQGNQYHATGSWTVRWPDAEYRSLAAWREATGQERVGTRASGTSADPCLSGGALPDITSPANAAAIVPRCPHAGLDLRSLFGTDPGPVDYFGHRLTTPPVIGAAQPWKRADREEHRARVRHMSTLAPVIRQ